jgi:hypothetical protein
MSYIINKSDGSVLVNGLLNNTIDQTSTSLTLFGKNITNYGELFNENFIHLLENFSNSSAPLYPITGQIWYDTSVKRLKIYDGTQFTTTGGPIVSTITPTLVQGDIWINDTTNQMYFNDGTDTILVGPSFSLQQGASGSLVESVLDQSGNTKTIVKYYVGNALIGIFSKEEFTPSTPIDEFSGTIKKGFTASTMAGMKFNVTASKADALVDALGNLKTTASFVATDQNSSSTGTLSIQNTIPLIIGPNQNNEVHITPGSFQIISNTSGQDFRIKVKSGSQVVDAIAIDSVNKYVGIFNDSPTSTLDVTGNVTISGNITVSGKQFVSWLTITANRTAVAGDRLIVDTTSGAITVTLPGSPSIGDYVTFVDGSTNGFDTNSLIINRNGSKINAATSNLTVSTEGAAFTLLYSGSKRGWVFDKVSV